MKNFKNITIILLLFFIVSTIWFKKCLEYNKNKNYKEWLNKAFELIIKQAKNKNCNTIKIWNENEEIELINTKCIKK